MSTGNECQRFRYFSLSQGESHVTYAHTCLTWIYEQLTPLEQSFIAPDLGEEVVMRRLCVLLALKQAYIKAIGQPMGFDWSRLEFNIPQKTASGDGVVRRVEDALEEVVRLDLEEGVVRVDAVRAEGLEHELALPAEAVAVGREADLER